MAAITSTPLVPLEEYIARFVEGREKLLGERLFAEIHRAVHIEQHVGVKLVSRSAA